MGPESFLFFVIFLSLASTALTIWAVIDIIQKPFKKKNDKTLWAVIVLLLGGIGPLIYLFKRKSLYLPEDRREYLPELEDEWAEPQRAARYDESDGYV